MADLDEITGDTVSTLQERVPRYVKDKKWKVKFPSAVKELEGLWAERGGKAGVRSSVNECSDGSEDSPFFDAEDVEVGGDDEVEFVGTLSSINGSGIVSSVSPDKKLKLEKGAVAGGDIGEGVPSMGKRGVLRKTKASRGNKTKAVGKEVEDVAREKRVRPSEKDAETGRRKKRVKADRKGVAEEKIEIVGPVTDQKLAGDVGRSVRLSSGAGDATKGQPETGKGLGSHGGDSTPTMSASLTKKMGEGQGEEGSHSEAAVKVDKTEEDSGPVGIVSIDGEALPVAEKTEGAGSQGSALAGVGEGGLEVEDEGEKVSNSVGPTRSKEGKAGLQAGTPVGGASNGQGEEDRGVEKGKTDVDRKIARGLPGRELAGAEAKGAEGGALTPEEEQGAKAARRAGAVGSAVEAERTSKRKKGTKRRERDEAKGAPPGEAKDGATKGKAHVQEGALDDFEEEMRKGAESGLIDKGAESEAEAVSTRPLSARRRLKKVGEAQTHGKEGGDGPSGERAKGEKVDGDEGLKPAEIESSTEVTDKPVHEKDGDSREGGPSEGEQHLDDKREEHDAAAKGKDQDSRPSREGELSEDVPLASKARLGSNKSKEGRLPGGPQTGGSGVLKGSLQSCAIAEASCGEDGGGAGSAPGQVQDGKMGLSESDVIVKGEDMEVDVAAAQPLSTRKRLKKVGEKQRPGEKGADRPLSEEPVKRDGEAGDEDRGPSKAKAGAHADANIAAEKRSDRKEGRPKGDGHPVDGAGAKEGASLESEVKEGRPSKEGEPSRGVALASPGGKKERRAQLSIAPEAGRGGVVESELQSAAAKGSAGEEGVSQGPEVSPEAKPQKAGRGLRKKGTEGSKRSRKLEEEAPEEARDNAEESGEQEQEEPATSRKVKKTGKGKAIVGAAAKEREGEGKAPDGARMRQRLGVIAFQSPGHSKATKKEAPAEPASPAGEARAAASEGKKRVRKVGGSAPQREGRSGAKAEEESGRRSEHRKAVVKKAGETPASPERAGGAVNGDGKKRLRKVGESPPQAKAEGRDGAEVEKTRVSTDQPEKAGETPGSPEGASEEGRKGLKRVGGASPVAKAEGREGEEKRRTTGPERLLELVHKAEREDQELIQKHGKEPGGAAKRNLPEAQQKLKRA